MTTNSNIGIRSLFGTLATRPLASAVPEGTLYTDENQNIYEMSIVAGVDTWIAVTGAGAGGLSSKYFVNAPGSVPAVGFATIAGAIAAAVADGHTAANPAEIFIYPGTYVENVVMSDGINLVGLNAPAAMNLLNAGGTVEWTSAQPTINGSLSVALGTTVANITNLRLLGLGAGTPPITIGAIAVSVFGLYGCTIEQTGAASALLSSGGTGAPTVLNIDECQFVNHTTQGGTGGIGLTSAHTLNMLDSSVQCNAGTDTAISMGVAGTVNAQRIRTLGNISMAGAASTMTFDDCRITVSDATAYIAAGATASIINWTRGRLAGSTAQPNIAGTLTLNRAGYITSDVNGLQLSATVTQTVNRTLAIARTTRANGAADLTAANALLADHHTLSTAAGARVANLPAANTYPMGQIISFSQETGAANAINITPNGADTINGVNALIATAGTLKGCAQLMRNSAVATDWVVVSIT